MTTLLKRLQCSPLPARLATCHSSRVIEHARSVAFPPAFPLRAPSEVAGLRLVRGLNARRFSSAKCGGSMVIVRAEGNGGDEVGKGERFTVTTPLYYVNAAPHMGSAYPTIAADALRLHGRDVNFITGTDEHGEKIALAAAAKGRVPKEHCDAVAVEYQLLWKELGIAYDKFIRTTDDHREVLVAEFYKRVEEKGDIIRLSMKASIASTVRSIRVVVERLTMFDPAVHYSALDYSSACDIILGIASAGNVYMNDKSPWSLFKQGGSAAEDAAQRDTRWGGLKGGQLVADAQPIFQRLEDPDASDLLSSPAKTGGKKKKVNVKQKADSVIVNASAS